MPKKFYEINPWLKLTCLDIHKTSYDHLKIKIRILFVAPTLRIKTFSITALSVTTFSITVLSITTFSITMLSIMTFRATILSILTFSTTINDIQHNNTQHNY